MHAASDGAAGHAYGLRHMLVVASNASKLFRRPLQCSTCVLLVRTNVRHYPTTLGTGSWRHHNALRAWQLVEVASNQCSVATALHLMADFVGAMMRTGTKNGTQATQLARVPRMAHARAAVGLNTSGVDVQAAALPAWV